MRLGLLISIPGLVCLTVTAQVPDGASNTYVNATNAFVDVTIGTNGSFTLLTLGNNAMFTNAGSGTIGFSATARSNEVRLISPTARWFVGNQIHVGSNGSFNRLLVSNGATVRAFNGNLSLGVGSNNLAIVTGPGSTWSNANIFYVGFNGAGNRLVISNGGTLYNNNAQLGVNSSGVSNQAIVTGAGSMWSNRSDLTIGYGGAGARLEIRDGGLVRSRVGAIGAQVGATNILALITGVGSTWSNAAELYLGAQGPANQIIVEAGGTLRSAIGYVGANFTASNNLALITGAGSMWSNENALQVGAFSSHNGLVVSNGALVSVATNAVIGPTPNGNANSVRVTGANSRLVAGTLYVGSNSALNQLIITNGGQVFGLSPVSANLGWGASASNNLVLVTDPGSLWSNAVYLYLGINAAANQLVISNGGLVLADQSSVGLNVPASNTVVTVTGPGSRWETSGGMYLGFSSAANRLEIKNGGVVRNGGSSLSANLSSSNNLLLVTGPGSAFTNRISLYVGQNGGGNQMVVSNGALAFVGEAMTVGETIVSTNNRVVVEGGTLQVRRQSGNAILDIRRGTNVLNAGLMDVDRLIMTNSLACLDLNGGTLFTRGAIISNSARIWLGAAGNAAAIWSVQPGTMDHTLNVPLYIGGSSSFNQLLNTNGATMSGGTMIMGLNAGSVSNLALISGPSSKWSMADLYVGYTGNENRIIVTNGAFVSAVDSIIGGESGATNCEAVITGFGSVFSNSISGSLQIGSDGSTNRVRVENGGLLLGSVLVGGTIPSVGNVLTVTGPGSRVQVLTNSGTISVGFYGPASRMEVTDGGSVLGYQGEIGRNLTSSNNLALVTGAGSVWSNINDLYVGVSGAGSRLYVTNGGALYNYNGFLGGNTYSSNNQAWVIGPGSTWTNYRELSVGLNGKGNQLVVTNGGTVFTFANKYVGGNDGALSNTAVITGAGSAWLGDDSLYVGADGSFNRLFVRNGGRVVNGLGTLGGLFAANGNEVLVTDGGSVWTNQAELTVGDNGSGNTLAVSNGATVFSASSGFIGRGSGGSSNTTILTGFGTRWLLSSNLYVGSNGAFNRLVITNGAYAENSYCTVGVALSSSNNEVVVTGSGTIWTNRDVLNLGISGGGNRLMVSDGARLRSNLGYVGVNHSSSNNQAILTGPGTFWEMPNSLIFGSQSSGNRLVLSNGAAMSTDGAYVGASNICSNNLAVISGAGSAWTNNGPMYVGYFSPANLLMITNGGLLVSTRIITVGNNSFAPANRVIIAGGTLIMTTESLDIQRGTNVLDAGLMDLKQLMVTNGLGFFEFNGGKLISNATTNNNGRVFIVGNGANTASFQLRGGIHNFANGLNVTSNSLLTGIGTVLGTVNVAAGATLSPGASIGVLAFTNSPVLQGSTVMEISRNGTVLTNDQVQITGVLTYGGSLVVSNSGPTPLVSGNRFSLFSATAFSGGFTNILLPPLTVGLQWTNKLSLDGSIEVIPYVPAPVTLGIVRSNGNLLVSWPISGADYCLETTFDLSSPVSWKTVSNGITADDISFRFTVAATGQSARQFFRLAFPCSQSPATLTLQASANQMAVSWASNSFRLETTYSLSPPVVWQPINSGITDSNGLRTYSFTNNSTLTNQFFRLASP